MGRKLETVARPMPVLEATPLEARAARMVETMRPRTKALSRKRTSDLAGCTFTSTRSGGQVRNKHEGRETGARHQIRIGAANGPGDELVAHRPAVHEGKLHVALGPAVGGQPGKALHAHILPLAQKRPRRFP